MSFTIAGLGQALPTSSDQTDLCTAGSARTSHYFSKLSLLRIALLLSFGLIYSCRTLPTHLSLPRTHSRYNTLNLV